MRAATLLISLAAATFYIARAQDPESSLVFSSIEPAATVVETPPEAGVKLFTEETLQITDEVVNELLTNEETAEYADLFAFADSTLGDEGSATSQRRRRRLRRQQSSGCKSTPGDPRWPNAERWDVFNRLLGGALEKVVPIASVCYPNSEFNNYDAAQCAKITNEWHVDRTHADSDSSIMFPLFYGETCVQGTDKTASSACTLGGYSSYSVHVSNVAQIQLAVNFARSSNLRLVIKNTGHDYNGRSTGKHALSLWTHNLKKIQYVPNYTSSTYSGPVFKVGAGVQGFELYEAAERHGVTAVAGICPSVGVFGGYTSGGGHGPVMQLFGMGADQILELQVVTADGRFVTVSPNKNSDLYWAMLGGGGGTFGIITSAVVKVHPKIPVTTSVWSFTSGPVGPEVFWEAVKFFWDEMPKYNAAKTYSYFTVIRPFPGFYVFDMNPFFATKMTVEQFNSLTAPFFAKLSALGIPYNIETKYHTSFYPAYQATFATLDFAIGNTGSTPGTRILPKENWEDAALRNATFAAVRDAVDKALLIQGYHQAPSSDVTVANSVNPAFRNEAGMIIAINSITDMSPAGLKAGNEYFTNEILGPIREVTPLGGAYGNEADISEPNWQQAFWGDNYARLLSIKQKWDPTGLFYVHHGVGSEDWVVQDGERGVQTQDGMLCRV
ncbi:FAD binding domain-containing protein [Westerdykella ornata]|uniref:FAD binding domain-containing protein n=1 Tax=Westerdykella ornata TaxID=318751 RepID=A0A6A6JT43_WESOR|nr:FAD binding domain-containing protein [Westerdykella ornata]KAF2279781.1 FAD binding domain-containing protein [Westerdykella ornata]